MVTIGFFVVVFNLRFHFCLYCCHAFELQWSLIESSLLILLLLLPQLLLLLILLIELLPLVLLFESPDNNFMIRHPAVISIIQFIAVSVDDNAVLVQYVSCR